MTPQPIEEAKNRFRDAVRSLALGTGDLRNRVANALPAVFSLFEMGPGVPEHIKARIEDYRSEVERLSTPDSRISYWVSTLTDERVAEIAAWIIGAYGEIAISYGRQEATTLR